MIMNIFLLITKYKSIAMPQSYRFDIVVFIIMPKQDKLFDNE
jgi:hypothetical protein